MSLKVSLTLSQFTEKRSLNSSFPKPIHPKGKRLLSRYPKTGLSLLGDFCIQAAYAEVRVLNTHTIGDSLAYYT